MKESLEILEGSMLKSLTPAEPELIRLCRSKKWIAMAERCKSHPEEAKPTALALEGAGTTALAIAVRSGAPIGAFLSLVEANARQLVVFHKFSGSILHEALKHRAPFNVLRYILQSVIHYERVHHGHDKDHVSLFARQEELGHTVLDHMVVRSIKEMQHDGDCDGMWKIFRSIVLAYPPAISVMDADGNTPLLLALLTPGSGESEKEKAHVFRMVELMVNTCPSVVTIARKVKYRIPKHCEEVDSSPTVGDGSPTPLACAILYGRSERIIRLLLKAHGKLQVNPCLVLCSGYGEVPLHLATSMRSSMTVLRDLVEFDPTALQVQDMYHLTPLDWLWIRHVVDWCSITETVTTNVTPSTRRYLSPHFAGGWHDRTTATMKSSNNVGGKQAILESLLERICLLLPAAAKTMTKNFTHDNQGEQWSLLHSACAVPCPLAMVRLACREDPSSLGIPDLHAGRLPLHYAAARTGYRATVPVGVSREVRSMEEPSPALEIASKFVNATRVADANNQLPLHIAIDTAKSSSNDKDGGVLSKLLELYPDSLERRDGKTKLYPFLQAAEGPNASLNVTFMLLRKNPTLVL